MVNKVIKCSSCGSPLDINQNIKQCKCPYCGSINILSAKEKKIIIDDCKLIKQAHKYEGDSNVEKAIELYDGFLEMFPDNSLVNLARALISLADSPNDDVNIDLFYEYYKKGIEFSKDKTEALLFLMHQFVSYTIPLVCVWQVYAYKKLCDIDKKAARLRMSKNLSLLFSVQNVITELEKNCDLENVNNLVESEIETYKDFASGIVKFDNDLLDHYKRCYDLYLDEHEIRKAIKNVQKNYKKFSKRYC